MWRYLSCSRSLRPGYGGTRRGLLFLGILLLLAQLLVIWTPRADKPFRSDVKDFGVPLNEQPLRMDVTVGPFLEASANAVPMPQQDTAPPYLIVIVATFPRSGSSLLGELLSSVTHATYFFEPFFYHSMHNITELSDSLVTRELSDLLTCRLTDSPMLREARFRYFMWKTGAVQPRVPYSAHFMERRCNASAARVVKVFRPRLRAVLQLLDDDRLGPHVRVVHLLRDPRAVVNSQLNNTHIWTNAARDAVDLCVRLREDLALADGLRDARYTRVHYEHLAAKPRRTAVRLLRHLALPVTADLQLFLDQHWNQTSLHTVLRHASDMDPNLSAGERRARWRRRVKAMRNRNYFSTFRDSQFDPSHWQQELDPQIRQLLEAECPDALQMLDRDRLQADSAA